MGDWNTLHLFNDKIFYNETVPKLQGNGDLSGYYAQYVYNHCLGRKCDFSLEELIDEFKRIKNGFKDYPGFKEINDAQVFSTRYKWAFHLSRLFNYVVFTECADFLPNYYLGRRPLEGKFPDIALAGIGTLVIIELGRNNDNVFTAEGAGITGWITHEEAAELLYDIEELLEAGKVDDEEELDFIEDFTGFLRVAVSNNLGIIAGVDLDSSNLKNLPQFKLTKRELWNELNIEALALE